MRNTSLCWLTFQRGLTLKQTALQKKCTGSFLHLHFEISVTSANIWLVTLDVRAETHTVSHTMTVAVFQFPVVTDQGSPFPF